MTTARAAGGGSPTHCITCSDQAVEMEVVEVSGDGDLALCESASGDRETVDVALVDPVRPADRLLIHAGTAIARGGGRL